MGLALGTLLEVRNASKQRFLLPFFQPLLLHSSGHTSILLFLMTGKRRINIACPLGTRTTLTLGGPRERGREEYPGPWEKAPEKEG
jgi:hypothetical protein